MERDRPLDIVPNWVRCFCLTAVSLCVLAPFACIIGGIKTPRLLSPGIDPLTLRVIAESALMSGTVGLLSLVVSLLVTMAVVSFRYCPSDARLAWFCAVPMVFSVIVRLYTMLVLLGSKGIVNQILGKIGLAGLHLEILYTDKAVLLGLVTFLFPYAVTMTATIVGDRRRGEITAMIAAGASFPRSFFSAVVQRCRLELFGVFLVTTVVALGYFLTPAVLGGPQSRSISYVVYTRYMYLADIETCLRITGTLLMLEMAATILWFSLYCWKGQKR
jgi:ABC-type spermidine/putrescine transport system permease subunit I